MKAAEWSSRLVECRGLYITDIALNYLEEIVATLVRITQHREESYIIDERRRILEDHPVIHPGDKG